jgi:hypothetical protein
MDKKFLTSGVISGAYGLLRRIVLRVYYCLLPVRGLLAGVFVVGSFLFFFRNRAE